MDHFLRTLLKRVLLREYAKERSVDVQPVTQDGRNQIPGLPVRFPVCGDIEEQIAVIAKVPGQKENPTVHRLRLQQEIYLFVTTGRKLAGESMEQVF